MSDIGGKGSEGAGRSTGICWVVTSPPPLGPKSPDEVGAGWVGNSVVPNTPNAVYAVGGLVGYLPLLLDGWGFGPKPPAGVMTF